MSKLLAKFAALSKSVQPSEVDAVAKRAKINDELEEDQRREAKNILHRIKIKARTTKKATFVIKLIILAQQKSESKEAAILSVNAPVKVC
jgi:hypothetical protein